MAGSTWRACVSGGIASGPGRLLGERDDSGLGAHHRGQQPSHRRIVADNIRTVLPNVDSLGDLEISGARLVDHLKGPAWLTCLKLDAHGKPQNHALFIQGDKIIDSRVGIVIDQCYKQTYERFDLPPPAAKKPGP